MFFFSVFCFLSPLVWFFLWLPKEVLAVLFLLHHENGEFSILMKDIFCMSDCGKSHLQIKLLLVLFLVKEIFFSSMFPFSAGSLVLHKPAVDQGCQPFQFSLLYVES